MHPYFRKPPYLWSKHFQGAGLSQFLFNPMPFHVLEARVARWPCIWGWKLFKHRDMSRHHSNFFTTTIFAARNIHINPSFSFSGRIQASGFWPEKVKSSSCRGDPIGRFWSKPSDSDTLWIKCHSASNQMPISPQEVLQKKGVLHGFQSIIFGQTEKPGPTHHFCLLLIPQLRKHNLRHPAWSLQGD